MPTSRAFPLSLTIAACFAVGGLAAAGWGGAQSFLGHQALDRGIALSGGDAYEMALNEAGRFTAYRVGDNHLGLADIKLVDRELYLDVAPTPFGPHETLSHAGATLVPVASWDLGHAGRYEFTGPEGLDLLLVRDAEALSNQLATARAVGFGGVGAFGLGLLLAAFTLALSRAPERRRRRRTMRRRREGVVALPYAVAAEQIARAKAVAAEQAMPEQAMPEQTMPEQTMPELHLHPSSFEEMPIFVQEWEEPSFDTAA